MLEYWVLPCTSSNLLIDHSDCLLGSSRYLFPLGGLKVMVGDYDISKSLNLESTIKGLKGID